MTTPTPDNEERILKNMKRMWRRFLRRLKCKHTHTFKHYLPKETPWCYRGEPKGKHDGLVIEGCYLCGELSIKDWKA